MVHIVWSGRAGLTRLLGLLAATAVLATTCHGLAGSQAAADDALEVSGLAASPLPFDMPAPAELRASPRLVFAHYWPPLPVSIDNQDPAGDYYARNYLNPDGERGKHAAYGGHLRDRPIPRAPRSGSDWRLQDMKDEVRQAIAGGLDGFTLNVIQLRGGSDAKLWENSLLMMQAAREVDRDFKIVLMPDMSGSLSTKDVGTVAAGMAELAAFSSAYRLGDGRLLVSPFKAEAHTPAWWTSFMDTMREVHGIPVALLPTFVGNEQNLAPSYASISYGMSIWGSRNPAWNDPSLTFSTSPKGRAQKIKNLGVRWMQPVSVQDERPNQGVFDEAANTTNLRHTWQLARETDADLVQIPTWNDYTEGTHLAPSDKHGWTFLDASAYYLAWYKTGTAPRIVRDTVYLTHRTQLLSAQPSYPQTKLMSLRGGTAARDTVEALTFLTQPGEVTITVGDTTHVCAVAAGPDTCTVPLTTGKVKAVVRRDGTPVAAVASPHTVTSTPRVQDLQYVGASSGRTPDSTVPVADTPPLASPAPGGSGGTGTPAAPAEEADRPGASELTATAVGSDVILTWRPPTDARPVAWYEVQRSATAFATPGAVHVEKAADSRLATDAPVGTWHYRVTARFSDGTISAPTTAVAAVVRPA